MNKKIVLREMDVNKEDFVGGLVSWAERTWDEFGYFDIDAGEGYLHIHADYIEEEKPKPKDKKKGKRNPGRPKGSKNGGKNA